MDENRCLARTCANGLCAKYRVRGKKRCRMHGGAAGSGAPLGNQNALKHGKYSEEVISYNTEVRERLTHWSSLYKQLKENLRVH